MKDFFKDLGFFKDLMFKGVSVAMSLILATSLVGLSGCGACDTLFGKRTLDVESKMSHTVFLDPVTNDKKTIFLQVRNTTDKQDLDLTAHISEMMLCKGYQVVDRPELAHYLLQANVLQIGRSDLRAAQDALEKGFGAALTGAVIGGAIGSLAKHEREGAIVGGLIGGAVSSVTDAMVKDILYTAITDVQISERVANASLVKEKTKARLPQGKGSYKEITSTEKVEWKRYQTRVVSTANKVNLKFERAAPELITSMTRSITGIF